MMVAVSVRQQTDGCWQVEAPDFTGCIVSGADEGQTLARAKLAIETALADRLIAGKNLPNPQPVTHWQRSVRGADRRWYEVHINVTHIAAVARHQKSRLRK